MIYADFMVAAAYLIILLQYYISGGAPHLQTPSQASISFQTRLAATLLPYRALVAGAAIHNYTPRPPDQSKSACQPLHHKGGRSIPKGAPCKVKTKGQKENWRRMGAGFHYFSDTDLRRFTQIRWFIHYIIYMFLEPWRHSTTNNWIKLPITTTQSPTPKAHWNNRKAPASPLITRPGGANLDGHPV